MQSIKKSGSDEHDTIPKAALSGMQKIARGTPSNPELNLLSFLGVPSNFRKAVTTSFMSLRKHTLQHMLSFPPPQVFLSLTCRRNYIYY